MVACDDFRRGENLRWRHVFCGWLPIPTKYKTLTRQNLQFDISVVRLIQHKLSIQRKSKITWKLLNQINFLLSCFYTRENVKSTALSTPKIYLLNPLSRFTQIHPHPCINIALSRTNMCQVTLVTVNKSIIYASDSITINRWRFIY